MSIPVSGSGSPGQRQLARSSPSATGRSGTGSGRCAQNVAAESMSSRLVNRADPGALDRATPCSAMTVSGAGAPGCLGVGWSPESHRPYSAASCGSVSSPKRRVAASGVMPSPTSMVIGPRRPWAAAATRALNSAAPTATALPRSRRPSGGVFGGDANRHRSPSASTARVARCLRTGRGCRRGDDGAVPGLWTACAAGRRGRRRWPSRVRGAGRTPTRRRCAFAPSRVAHPGRSGEPPRPAPSRPRLTSAASCGHVERERSTSTNDAAIRGERRSASRCRRTCGIFSRLLIPGSNPASISPSSPWRMGRSG